VLLHQRLVRYLAGRFVSVGAVSLEDLVQVANVGLIAAIERYDPQVGERFVTFAAPTILGAIKRYLRDHGWMVKAPRRLRELSSSLRRHSTLLEQRLGRPPTVAEMAGAAGITEERLVQAMEVDHLYQPASLDARPRAEDGSEKEPLRELLGGFDPGLAAVDDQEAVRGAIQRLEKREKAIIEYRFYEEVSQAEVAERLGISQMHVSRLERRALERLRTMLL
jgi:RNA polymerase sigma-B factor